MTIRTVVLVTIAFLLALPFMAAEPAIAAAPIQGQEGPAAGPAIRRIGTVKAINGSNITLSPDSGAAVNVNLQPSARLLRIAPGEKDLKNATPIALSDLQVGDRVLVGGKLAEDGSTLNASSLVVMKLSDVSEHQQQTREDWQKRGIGGLVSGVDPANNTVTISVTGFGGKKTITVHASKSTAVRRYAPDSVKFEDARPSSLGEIQAGEQLRARGERSGDGSEFAADEIVTGRFRNIEGTVNSVDASAGTVTVQDVLSKKAVQVKITSDSQMHKLPPEFAQRIAMRLKASIAGNMPAGVPGASSAGTNAQGQAPQAGASGQSGANPPGAGAAGGGMGGMRSGGAPDFQQILSRMPTVSVSDLKKGDAVMIVTTEGSASGNSTAITLLSGVEPILQAAPNASQAMMLTPWSLGGAPGGDAGQ